MQNQTTRRPRLARPMALALAAAACCGAARADDDPNPYYIGARQAFTHDSNVFRVQDPTSDYYSSTSLIAGFNQPVSRQRFYGNANVTYNKYRNQDVLDNTSYGVEAGWDWATIERLSGNFNVEANRSLATLNGNSSNTVTADPKNMLSTQQASAKVLWGGDGLINLTGAYSHGRVRYTAVEYQQNESTNDTGSLGANYRLGEDLRVGVAYRQSRTESPFAIPLTAGGFDANTSTSKNTDLTLDWRLTPKTNINARLSHTRLTNSDPRVEGFSGTTGSFVGNYAATGKLSFTASYARDVGLNANFFNAVANGTAPGTPAAGLTQSVTQNTQVSDTYVLGAQFAATAKIGLNAQYLQRNGKTVTTDDTDDFKIASLGATYDVARAWQLGCKFSHESRSISGTPPFSYSANVVGCSAQFKLQ